MNFGFLMFIRRQSVDHLATVETQSFKKLRNPFISQELGVICKHSQGLFPLYTTSRRHEVNLSFVYVGSSDI